MLKNEIIAWIRSYFAVNGPDASAVIGMSGGKDSTISAALCAKALGPEHVIGVLMPNGPMDADYWRAVDICKYLGIRAFTINIEEAYKAFDKQLSACNTYGSDYKHMATNIPPRIRMTYLYGIAALYHGRVCCTSNASERAVGYTTKWGDNVGDFAPLVNYTVTEVYQLGAELQLPTEYYQIPPADGLTGKTDEEVLGFTYANVDAWLNDDYESPCYPDKDVLAKIIKRNIASAHKRKHIANTCDIMR